MYQAAASRYDQMLYRRAGRSGLSLPAISLGFWHNFGGSDTYETGRAVARLAFDRGITHFDLANNYGPPYGSAEETFGKLMRDDFHPYRDELVISTKAGWDMWPGPYGDFGSKKYLIASLDQSLKRMGLDYVDIFYHHRPDPDTPMEETVEAMVQMVRQGKALYLGISSYEPDETERFIDLLSKENIHLLVHQPSYSLLDRWIEDGLDNVLAKNGVGTVVFSPLAQGLLTSRYLGGEIPKDSRAARRVFLSPDDITPALLEQLHQLDHIARQRGQSLAQMALSWVLRDDRVTSAIIGASRPSQLEENLDALKNLHFTKDELTQIDRLLQDA